mmetsp:Transcript_9226/g.24809  ORF Transcript_9226/g.24809 Transcript_9226/m.24809 type:complete len:242 (-) Transcript_9226:846-1571(-)
MDKQGRTWSSAKHTTHDCPAEDACCWLRSSSTFFQYAKFALAPSRMGRAPGKACVNVLNRGRPTMLKKPGCDLLTPALVRSMSGDTCMPFTFSRSPCWKYSSSKCATHRLCTSLGAARLPRSAHLSATARARLLSSSSCSSTAAATAAEGSCCVSAVAGGCCCCCCGSGCCCSCDAPEAAAADKLTGATRLSSVSWEEAPTLDLKREVCEKCCFMSVANTMVMICLRMVSRTSLGERARKL